MNVRSPGLLALSLLLLASAGALGGILVHDGAHIAASAMLEDAGPGDEVRLRGEIENLRHASDKALGAYEARFVVEGLDALVVLTSFDPLPDEGLWVVAGTLLFETEDRSLLVIEVDEVTAPFVFD